MDLVGHRWMFLLLFLYGQPNETPHFELLGGLF
jgi:hypothetical protein